MNDIRRQNVILLNAERAQRLGFSASEAAERAPLWFDFDEIVYGQGLSTPEAATIGGEGLGVDLVWSRMLPTRRLRAMVKRLKVHRFLPPPPEAYVRHGWGPGPHGLSP